MSSICPPEGDLPAASCLPSSSSRFPAGPSNNDHARADSDAPNAPPSLAWDTDWSLPGPPGCDHPHHQDLCRHEIPATPQQAWENQREHYLRQPDFVYCDPCQDIVCRLRELHSEIRRSKQRWGETDTSRAKACGKLLAGDLRPRIMDHANDCAAEEDNAGQMVVDRDDGAQPQQAAKGSKKVRFASHAEVVSKYRFDPDGGEAVPTSRGLMQRVKVRNGETLGERRESWRQTSSRRKKHKKWYRSGKFPTLNPLNTSFWASKYQWKDAKIGHGEHMFELDDYEDEEEKRKKRKERKEKKEREKEKDEGEDEEMEDTEGTLLLQPTAPANDSA